MTQPQESTCSSRETWMIRLALGAFVFFTVFGIYLLFFPTDLLTIIFGILLLITLGLGVLVGLMTVYLS